MATTTAQAPAFDVAATIARLQKQIESEAGMPQPATLADVPISVQDVNPAWLTAVLCRNTPGAAVESVVVSGGSDGSTSRRALRLTYNAAGMQAGLPTKIFGKATPTLQNRLVCGLSGAVFTERDFYLHVRPELDIEAPVAFHAATDADSFRSVILFADMTDTGTVFTDPYYYIDRAKAEDMARLMATYHAQLLGQSLTDRMPMLKTTLAFQQDVNVGIDFEGRSAIGVDRASAVIPQSIKSRKKAMWDDGLMRSLEQNIAAPRTLAHCDVHIGNWYVTAEGRMGLTDWQCAASGNGVVDLSYALSSALKIEDRRAWERDLVAIYAERLAELGAGAHDAVDFETIWLRYRQQMFHGFYNWVYTIGAGEMQPDMQPEAISMINIERMAAAIDDLDSFALVNA